MVHAHFNCDKFTQNFSLKVIWFIFSFYPHVYLFIYLFFGQEIAFIGECIKEGTELMHMSAGPAICPGDHD